VKKSIVFILTIVATNLYAQTIDSQEVEFRITLPEVSLVSIAPDNSTITLALENTEIAGEKVKYSSKTDPQLWLNYTCSIAPNSPSKNLTAQIISGNVPDGLELQLNVSEYSGSGKGNFGTPISKINLQNYPQNIISNIGGSYTNKGVNNGHKLEYAIAITNYEQLDSENSNILTIVYTISDN